MIIQSSREKYNNFEKFESQWTFDLHGEFDLPIQIVCKSMPIGTMFFGTEAQALKYQISKLTKAQLRLINRLEINNDDNP